jgi:hypothetical protein
LVTGYSPKRPYEQFLRFEEGCSLARYVLNHQNGHHELRGVRELREIYGLELG